MFQGKAGKPTYNTLNARALLQRWVPEALREVAPPEPERAEPTSEAGSCFRRVVAILEGKANLAPLPVACKPSAPEAARDMYEALYNLPAVPR